MDLLSMKKYNLTFEKAIFKGLQIGVFTQMLMLHWLIFGINAMQICFSLLLFSFLVKILITNQH